MPTECSFSNVSILSLIGGELGSKIFLMFSSAVVIVSPTSIWLNFLSNSISRNTRGDLV